jgi:hypothetical protein
MGNKFTKTKKTEPTIQTDRKTVNFKSKDGKLTGVLGLMPYAKNPRYVHAVYNIKIQDALKENWACKNEDPSLCSKSVEYTYGLNLKEKDNDSNEGTINAVQCAKDWFFTDPFTLDSRSYEFSRCFNSLPIEQRVTKQTNVFYAWFTKTYNNYEDYKQNNVIELFDLQKYWVITEKKADTQTWSVDIAKSMKETQPTVSYELEFTN